VEQESEQTADPGLPEMTYCMCACVYACVCACVHAFVCIVQSGKCSASDAG